MKSLYQTSQIRPFILAALTLTSLIGVIVIQLPNQTTIFGSTSTKIIGINVTLLEEDNYSSNYSSNSSNNTNSLLQTIATVAPDLPCWNKPWPDLELYLTVPPDGTGEREYRDIFLPSLALFWPKRHMKFVIVTDADDSRSPDFASWAVDLAKRSTGVETRAVFTRRVFPCPGWHKSQWLKFWADNFTKSEYVGFVDSDTLFITRVTLTDLFVDGRPIVRPIYGRPKAADINYWSRAPQRTLDYTGHREPFNCMSYFPVIVKTAHLRFFREEVTKRVNPGGTFDEAFRRIVKGNFYSEYNIMCAFMWYNFRDQYFWVVNESEMGWSGYVPGQIANFKEGNITKEHLKPRPHICIHPGHGEPFRGVPHALRKGVCFSMTNSEQRPAYCKDYPNRTLAVNSMEFQFETDDFSRRPGTFEAHLHRIAENEKCPHEWPSDRLALLN